MNTNTTTNNHRSVDSILTELRAHPEVVTVIAWVKDDLRAAGMNPDTFVGAKVLEEASIERGWDVLDSLPDS